MVDEEELLRASIERLASELKKRADERRVEGPHRVIVTGVPPRQDSAPDVLAKLGIESPVHVIVTGVPRAGRDDDEDVAAYAADIAARSTPAYDRYAKPEPVETVRVPPLPQPTPEPLASEPRYPVRCTVRLPDPDKDDPGQIIEATYSLTGKALRVYDDEGRVIGSERLMPGDDAEAAARKILREKHGKHLGFYEPIPYGPQNVF